MKKVLSIGSVNMDYTLYVDSFPLPGETIFGHTRYIQPGGKGENQIIAVSKSHKVEAYGKHTDKVQDKCGNHCPVHIVHSLFPLD